MLYDLLSTCLKDFSPFQKPLFQLLKQDEALGVPDSGDCWCATFPICSRSGPKPQGRWSRATVHMLPVAGLPSGSAASPFCMAVSMGGWLKVLSGTPLVVTRLRGYEKDDKGTYFWVFWINKNTVLQGGKMVPFLLLWKWAQLLQALPHEVVVGICWRPHRGHGELMRKLVSWPKTNLQE